MPSLEKRKINVSVSSKGRDAVYAKANTNEIKHVLVNILNNAKDAIMDIKEKDRMFDGKITIEIESGENEICIVRITDNGGGINQSVMDKIFNPYVTTKLSKDGSGLGLYMCKTIIEKHKGTMSVKNTEGGASFEITLPGLG
jgi:signal transduction histidine kinase